jgi:hypothetical protein
MPPPPPIFLFFPPFFPSAPRQDGWAGGHDRHGIWLAFVGGLRLRPHIGGQHGRVRPGLRRMRCGIRPHISRERARGNARVCFDSAWPPWLAALTLRNRAATIIATATSTPTATAAATATCGPAPAAPTRTSTSSATVSTAAVAIAAATSASTAAPAA